jgi:Cytochrome c oxidase assembly protein COX16
MSNKARRTSSNIMLTAGAPMVLFIVGGSVALGNFMQTHFELKDKAKNSKTVRKFDLEEEHANIMKQLNVQEFSLSRIPRPEELEEATKARLALKEKKKWSPKTAATAKEEKSQTNSVSKILESPKPVALNKDDKPLSVSTVDSIDKTAAAEITNKPKKGWLW